MAGTCNFRIDRIAL